MKKHKSASTEESLAEISTQLRRYGSLRHIFLHGVAKGVGTALGATVIVALITSMTLHFANSPHVDALVKTAMESLVK